MRALAGDKRATPDISMSAAVDGAALVYLSFIKGAPGYYLTGGTSEASPLFSGVVAIAAQMNGGRLGDINPALYQLGESGIRTGIVDVTKGDISFGGVTGPAAKKGYDLASGWGTVDADASPRRWPADRPAARSGRCASTARPDQCQAGAVAPARSGAQRVWCTGASRWTGVSIPASRALSCSAR